MTEVLPGARWVYEGTWSVLSGLLRVPRSPPELPGAEHVTALRPAAGYLQYLRIVFWMVALLVNGCLVAMVAVITVVQPPAGIFLAIPLLLVGLIPTLAAYIAIHIKYDTTWYVLSDRSIRIRRGVWIIHETTITFENVQNVVTDQGPLERLFGISNVMIETAGGGAGAGPHGHGQNLHVGVIEGIANAQEIREMIMTRVEASRSAGLGDERHRDQHAPRSGTSHGTWTRDHIQVLREISQALSNVR